MKSVVDLSLSLLPLATTAVPRTIAASCKKLQKLNISDCDAVTDESCAWLAAGCPLLDTLDLSDCANLTEAGLIQFVDIRKQQHVAAGSPVPPRFKSLKLNGLSASLTDKSLLALISGEPECPLDYAMSLEKEKPHHSFKIPIQTLELSNISAITSDSFHALAVCLYTNCLTTLNLSHLIVPLDSVESLSISLSAFFRTQKSLKTILLTGGLSGAVENSVCEAISTHCTTHLETLDMSECTQVSDPGTQRIASSCRALTNVNWKGCMGVTDTTITSFFVNPITNEPHATLPNLRYLNVGLCNKISDTSTFQLSRLIQGNSKPTSNVGLHTLKFSGCFNVSDASLDSLRTMILESSCNETNTTTTTTATAIPTGSLRLLCFSGCYKITTPAITALTTLLPHLESINLYSCPQVTNEAIISISKTCPRLLSLVISKCPLGDGAAVALGEGCSRLHTLYMSFLTGSASGGGGGVWGLTDVGVKAILRGCRELKLLDLSRCDGVTDDGFFLAVENQCYLDGDCRMDIDDDDDNGDDGDDLADKSERAGNLGLQVLIVRACPRLTFEGMSRFVGKCPRLLTLDVLGCAGFGVRERERMKELVERGTG